ncbi:unnamed protein product [Rotaria sp. Silwood1]|nr:unnamed protein product [Rotaria sp. Silwood1]
MVKHILPNLHRIDVPENKEDFLLIWLDRNNNSNINNNNNSSIHHIQTTLVKINPAAQFYTDIRRCENFIRTTKDENVLLIISGVSAPSHESLLVQLFGIQCIRGVFIYCQNRDPKKQNSNYQHTKVIGYFLNFNEMIISIEKTIHLLKNKTYKYNLFNQQQKSTRDLSKEEASFVWHQLLVHVLKQMTNDEQAKIDMLNQCKTYYQHSKKQLANIEEFSSMYSPEKAIYWYTKESFVYRLLNRAFRTENIELIYAFRYFIIDLCAQIEQKSHSMKTSDILNLYRGQQISTEEFHKLKQSIGKLISPNGFFSTSRSEKVSLAYAGESSEQIKAVLFKIEVDPTLKSIICADIEDETAFTGEYEVLFSIGATFRIGAIEYDTNLKVWTIQLTSTNDGFERVQEYLKVAENEMKDMSPMVYFGSLLLFELGQIDHAEKYFNVLLKILPCDHTDIASLKTGLGHVHLRRGNYNEALEYYQFAYNIRRETLSILNPRIGASLRNIGNVYRLMGNFDQALNYYRQAMRINESNYSNKHIVIAMTMEEIGLVYQNKNELVTALHWFEDALETFKHVLPLQHPQIAACLGHIGHVYQCMNEYECSLEYLHQELKMDESCLPLDHIDVINDLRRIVEIYRIMNEYNKGLKFCREKLENYKILLGENHSRCVNTLLCTIGLLVKKFEYDEALDLSQRALKIVLNTVPFDIYSTIECLQYISYIYQIREDFVNSLEYRERQLEMEKAIYPLNHPNIASSLVSIGMIRYEMGQYTISLELLHEALTVYKEMSPPTKDMIKLVQEHINRVERKQIIVRKSRAWSPVRFQSRKSKPERSRSERSTPKESTHVRSTSEESRPIRSISEKSTLVLSKSGSNSRVNSTSDLDLEILKLKLSFADISLPDTVRDVTDEPIVYFD